MDDEELISLIGQAVNAAYAEEPPLSDFQGNEQSFAFRIGLHLNDLLKASSLKDLNLDCEYNKNRNDPKRNAEGNSIRPDLLIHKRGTHDHNILAAEFKGWWNDKDDADKQKLINLTKADGGYDYQLGAFIKLRKETAEYTFYKNGYEVQVNG